MTAQDFSNKGKDFWIGYGNHVRMFTGSPAEKMQLYITSDVATTGQVSIASIGFIQNFTVQPNQITTIDIPRTAALLDDGLYNHGIHVTAEKPVVVYSFIYVSAISGATVCLPTSTLGRDYYSVNYTQRSNERDSYSYFFVIAADTGTTTIEITPAANTKGGKAANVPFLVTLQQGQIYNVMGTVSGNTGDDLTGSRIRSLNNGSGCKRIAVFCGSGKIGIGCTAAGTSDNLYQEMYPTATWGKKYVTVPSLSNPTNIFRIIKSDASANVTLNGTTLPATSFINNFYYEFTSNTTNVIESDKPILVAEYFTTQRCEGNPSDGDPEMIYLNPVEQTIAAVTLNSMQPAGVNINTHFLNVVLKNDAGAINSFKLDGVPYKNFNPVPQDANYIYAQISTTAGTHSITCDTGFNIIAYGFGNAESYGFSGGMNLKDLYQYISIENRYSIVDYPATCTNSPFNFSMTFPYMPTKVQWQFGGLYPDVLINAPVPDSTFIKNGRQLYLYRLTGTYNGPVPGTYPIKIIANNPTADGCTGEQEVDFDLRVYPEPTADFAFTGTCLGDTTFFTNQSQTGDNPVIKWTWSFGNGDASNIKDPYYLYKTIASNTVSLSAITQVGCLTDTIQKVVTINPLPVASFQTTGPYCEGHNIFIQDVSTISRGNIAAYTWNMGDGQTFTRTSNAGFNYVYPSTGSYTIDLTVKSDQGCSNKTPGKQIAITAQPKVGFILPENCLSDPFSKFIDTSAIADGTQASFQYLWNFGDPNATAANNTAIVKEPQHKYTATGNYPVSMRVTSGNGCADSVKQVLTINGTTPQAAFAFADGNSICSNKMLTFTNNSLVDFGNIVRLEVYWDYGNDPTNKTIDEEPASGKKYNFQYPALYTPATKDYLVQVVAYSGETCLSTSTKTLTTKVIPELQFNPIDPVCLDVAPFQITQASVLNGLTGDGIYLGQGVGKTGLFTPKIARPGIDTIQYVFTAVNNCVNTIKQTVQVYPLPVVYAGADCYLLEGNFLTIPATASGNKLNYVWSPATALSNPVILNPNASPVDEISYTLTATSADGCKASDDITIKVLKNLHIPNAFSPNGDGIHDRWEIKYLNTYPGATVELYNRYGQLVYRSAGYSQSWDGTFNGNPLPVGTYYYIINPKNGRNQLSGYVDLIR
ncbi:MULTISPECIES: gliding motility-associated C-terminal domain-containing protein [Niastella]|uniref:Gliding motility-associated C-terminal domain-containing protein n=1 Tax=Niastella soli TaxID=2821487 RepID=A0ABS3YLB0_9BACT|nr:gliding motility-associated C-terminal domain-containing protein [Niastella soli]MBO9198668.1 gliding motility-associated C-terminal domain-containing protein [Niastella soli]